LDLSVALRSFDSCLFDALAESASPGATNDCFDDKWMIGWFLRWVYFIQVACLSFTVEPIQFNTLSIEDYATYHLCD